MADRLERLTNLTATLLDTRRPLPLEEILERVPGYPADRESARRQFERDKDALRGIGIPLELVDGPFGDVAGYRVDPRQYELPELDLTAEERAALHAAVTAVRLDGGEGRHALWKLGGIAGEGEPLVGALPVLDALPALVDACRTRSVVHFEHRSRSRSLDPYAVVFRDGYWYVLGRDHDRDEVRTYRVDRITGDVDAGDAGAFERPGGFDPDAVLHDQPWRYGEEAPVQALVEVDAVAAPELLRRLGDTAVVELAPDGTALVTLTVTNRHAFRSFVLGLRDRAVVVSPPELRTEMTSWLEAMAAAGGKGAS